MTEPSSGDRPAEETTPVCTCGHSFEKHLGYAGIRQDPCAGGEPGFCGCSGYCPATPPAVRTGDDELRQQVQAWIDEAPDQTAGLDLLRQIVATEADG